MFTGVQEAAIVNLVLANNEIQLREIQSHIIQDNTIFNKSICQHWVAFSSETISVWNNFIRCLLRETLKETKSSDHGAPHGVLHCHSNLIPYNTAHILAFLDRLHTILIPPEHMNDSDHQRNWYNVVLGNMSFHHVVQVQNWFTGHPPFLVRYLLPYSPFLNPLEGFFSEWRWKVYDQLTTFFAHASWKRHVMKLMWVWFRDG